MQYYSNIGELGPYLAFASQEVISAISVSDQCWAADILAYLGLLWSTEEVDDDRPPHLSGPTVDVLGLSLEAEGDWELSDISRFGSIWRSPQVRGDFLLIHESVKINWSISRVVHLIHSSLTLGDWNSLAKKGQLLSSMERLRSDARTSPTHVYSLERQLAAHPAPLDFLCGKLVRLEVALDVIWGQLSTF